jgi:hypothetical protein
MSGSNVVPLPRKPRASDIVAEALAEGKKLPLTVMLDSMWKLVAEAERLEASEDPGDQLIARVARERAFRAASECAPFLHPKIAATIITGDEDGGPVRLARADRFAKLTDEEATRLLKALEAGSMTIDEVNAAIT